MPIAPPARVGEPFDAIDTPALLIDLDAFERNLATMAERAKRFGVRLRPHAKTHKSAVIARRQMALGAVGMCCQKVSEAEVLVLGGVDDVLVSNEVIGERKVARLAALARQARIGVCIDAPLGVTQLAGAAHCFSATIDAYVEIDAGQKRCGVATVDEAVALARRIAEAGPLRFAGLQAYHGAAQHYRTAAERRAAIEAAAGFVRAVVWGLEHAGIACPLVTGAGTGTHAIEGTSGLWGEIQPGSYIFMDADYAQNEGDTGGPFRDFAHALFVKATVMSRSAPGRAVLDAGHKALSNDSGFPRVVGFEARYHRPSDEHGMLEMAAGETGPGLGDAVLLIPGHCDPTVNLYDWYVGVRGLGSPQAYVEALWPVDGRGAVA